MDDRSTRSRRRYCRCGTRLAADNRLTLCAVCQKRAHMVLAEPPAVPSEFWQTDIMRDALEEWHFGRVIQAYRHHPWHGRPLTQHTVAAWLGMTQAQLSRLENGTPPHDLAKLVQWARALRVPAKLMWFSLPGGSASAGPSSPCRSEDVEALPNGDSVNRRELLRVMGLASSLLTLRAADELDVERLSAAGRDGAVGSTTLDEFGRLNSRLWQELTQANRKRDILPLVRRQLDILTRHLRLAQPTSIHQRLCELTGELFQLCGEILFDSGEYGEAGQCYVLAASASKEAGAADLWACSLTRHAFIGLFDRRFDHAAPLLEGATELSRRGDRALPTRHWAAAVEAQTFAALGDTTRCRRAMDASALVVELDTPAATGWLRFTGARLAEERGSCFIALGQPELAEPPLHEALRTSLTSRRRGGVLTDLAVAGAQRGDAEQAVLYGNAAVDAARHTASAGYVGRKLSTLQPHLRPLLGDRHVRHLDNQITALTATH